MLHSELLLFRPSEKLNIPAIGATGGTLSQMFSGHNLGFIKFIPDAL